ncbi:hypothetical protein ACG1VR_17765 [Cedecea davisae]|uniref:hypothetical protein n=1 Tax=Cedecea davisae TaxID=158484 RepID=UPI00376F0CC1
MPANVQENSRHIPSLPIYIRDNNNDDASPDKKETSPLTSKIKNVNNSKDKPSGSGNKSFTGKAFGTLNNLLVQRSGQTNVEMEDDGVGIPLAEVITGGEALRSQAESLLRSRDEQPVPRAWNGGMFQRLLVGAGILTGIGTLGGAGYKYYAGRSSPGERAENTAQNSSTEPSLNPVNVYNRSEATPAGVFTTLQSDGSTKSKPRHIRRHLPHPATGTTASPELPAGILDDGKMSKEELLVTVAEYLLDGKDSINKERLILLARSIQSASGLFAGVKGQVNALAKAELIVRQWFFYNTLGSQAEECVLDVIINKVQPHDYVVGQIPSFLHLTKYLTLDSLTQSQVKSLNNLWRIFLIKEIPLLRVLDYSVAGLKVREDDFFDLYVGTKALDGFQSYSPEEAMEMGQVINYIASRNSTLNEQVDLLKIPYLLSDNKYFSDENIEKDGKKPDALEKYIHGMNVVNEINKHIEKKYNEYSSSIELLVANDAMQNNSFESLSSKNNSYIKLPEDLPDEYWSLAHSVTEKFEKLDEILILAAFGELPEKEREYISSSQISIHPMSIIMRAKESGAAVSGRTHINNISLREDDVDLISVRLGEEERIYALEKKKNDQPGYHFIRVDRDIRRYIESGILDYHIDDFLSADNNTITCGDDTFSYVINTREDIVQGEHGSNGGDIFINHLSATHKMNMHIYLDPSAVSPVRRDEFSSVVKKKIPFYNYIQAGLESKSVDRAPSCRTRAGLPMTVELANIIASSGIVDITPELTLDKLDPALSSSAKEELRNLVSDGFLNKKIMDIEQQITAISGYLFDGENGITKDEGRILLLAREIFDNSELFKGKDLEEISVVQAKSIIRLWYFDTLMGTQPDDFILDTMSRGRRPQGYTVGDISDLLHLFNFFIKDGFSEQQLTSVHSVWHALLMEKLPLLKLDKNSVKNINLWDFRFSNLYAGTQFLESHSLQDYTADEAMKVGEMLWGVADKERWVVGRNNLFKMPALIFIESGNPKLNNRNKFYKFLAINEYVNYRATIKETEENIINTMIIYPL